ncbi:MAG: hypothetical protein Q8P52_02300 [bacterium]|nr:hypothetical protein [bacterium]
MLGILDRWYAARECRDGYVDEKCDWHPTTSDHDGDITWLCFVPRIVSRTPFISRGLLPREGNVVVYTINSFDLILPDPDETIAKLGRIYEDALEKIAGTFGQKRPIGLLGVSLGNVLSIRLASEASNIKRIVSIVGGGHLGLSAWDSILTRHIAEKSGCRSAQEYENRLGVFSPANYIRKITAKNVLIRLGTHDKLIRFHHGQKLVSAFQKRSADVAMKIDYRPYRGSDHASAMLFSALEKPCRPI